MKPFNTKERFSIPNLMGYFRLLLIPVFCYLYLAKEAYHWAAGVVLLSSLTDLFDGMIARKFNMITNLGKALDPIADQLTHGIGSLSGLPLSPDVGPVWSYGAQGGLHGGYGPALFQKRENAQSENILGIRIPPHPCDFSIK